MINLRLNSNLSTNYSYFYFLSALFLILGSVFFVQKAKAATLSSVSDTITTSRPSASAPLSSDLSSSGTQATLTDNGSIFLASDSATLRSDTGETLDSGVTVASMSATNTPSSGKRIVYFVSTAGHSHHAGDPVTVPITAMHKISFGIPTSVPASGKIIITFPALASGDANTAASPSASTFQLNSLSSSLISYKLDGTRTCTFSFTNPSSGVGPAITCTVDSGGSIAHGTTLTFLIGCSDSSSNETSCTTQSPTLINPTKTAGAGTADTWTLQIQTQDSNGVVIDSAKAKIATIESVQVQANVDPTLTFTIAAVADATTIDSDNSACTSNTDVTNTGIAPTATTVNLGTLSSGAINIAAQDLTVSTNAQNGYSMTATSSGTLINPSTGYAISSGTSPYFLTAGTEKFGVHPCGTDVATATWGSGTTGSGANAKYAWPTPTTSVSLASRTSVASGIKTTIEYASTISGTTPAGLYSSVITYVVTPTF